jgi:CRP-like cAMP-binding protein
VVSLETLHFSKLNILLGAFTPEDLRLLKPHLREVTLQQGTLLHEQGERIEHVYFPHQGLVSLLAVMHHGHAVETATIGREGAIGWLTAFGPRRSHARAVVQVAGTASRIASPRFRAAVEKSATMRHVLAVYGERMLIQVQQTAACNALHDVEARLSRWLLEARDRLDSDTIELTHEFLSQMLGVRRTTVTVVAHMLQQAGLIRYRRGHINIVDRRGLEARACECYEAVRRQVAQLTKLAKPGWA